MAACALITDRNTSPETVFFVPVEPMIVTLISRPDTPRLRRSSFTTLPTFVRLSPASHVESCERVYVAVFHEMYGDDAS